MAGGSVQAKARAQLWDGSQWVDAPGDATNGLKVQVQGTVPVSGTFYQATQPVSAASLPLPSGAATSAKQDTGNTSVASIDTKTPALSSGRVPVDGSGVTQPVSGTFWQATQPVSGPLTDTQLRATAVPVSGTFWQATQPVSLATNTPDVTDRAAREVGRARLWDGTDEATVIPRGTAPTSSDKGVAVTSLMTRLPTYQVVTAEITSATSTGVKENLTLWHPNTLAKDVLIVEIGVNVRVVQTAGTFAWELQFISAENGTPGGNTLTPQPLNLGDAASGLTVRSVVTGAPTTTGQVFQRAAFPLPAAAAPFVGSSEEATIIFKAADPGEGITLRSGQSEGLRITQNVAATLTTAPIFTVYVRFIERA